MRLLVLLAFGISLSAQALSCVNCLQHSQVTLEVTADTPPCHSSSQEQDKSSCPACEMNLCSAWQKLTDNEVTIEEANPLEIKNSTANAVALWDSVLSSPPSVSLKKTDITLAKNKNWQAFHSVFLN